MPLFSRLLALLRGTPPPIEEPDAISFEGDPDEEARKHVEWHDAHPDRRCDQPDLLTLDRKLLTHPSRRP